MAETEKVTRPMDRLRDRYAAKYPDREYSGENAEDALVADILAELESRIGPLKTQSEKAMKFLASSKSGCSKPASRAISYALGIPNPILSA